MRYNLVMARLGIALALLVVACSSQKKLQGAETLTLEPLCAEGTRFQGNDCVVPGSARAMLEQATAALTDFDVQLAMPLLEAALSDGPHDHDLLIGLHEQRGIALSYLKREDEARAAFHKLLTLDPGHLLSYTLSPQATFLYEQVRKAKAKEPRALVDLSWPQNLREDQPIALAVEVVSDPQSMLDRMALFVRTSEEDPYARVPLVLPKTGEVRTVHLPPAGTNRPTTLQLYGRVYDHEGDEVLLWFGADQPREIALSYQAPSPWYRKWWVWAAIGGAVAAGTGTTVYVLGLEPPDLIDGGFSF